MYCYYFDSERNTIRVELYTKCGCIGVRLSTLAEVLAPWRALTELLATLAEPYTPIDTVVAYTR